MPVHDWKAVPTGIFHDFHNAWIFCIKQALNHGILPDGYYSLSELYAGPFSPDVLALHQSSFLSEETSRRSDGRTALLTKPRRKPIATTEMEFYRSKQKMLTVRTVGDDEIVAVLEIVSPGNKSHRGRFRELVDKAAWFLDQRIHLGIIDLFPPTRRDPNGIHDAIWQAISDQKYVPPHGKRNRTAISYECGLLVQAYVEHFGVGDKLPDLPLFLEYGGCVDVPLEKTYRQAFDEVPKRWRDVLK